MIEFGTSFQCCGVKPFRDTPRPGKPPAMNLPNKPTGDYDSQMDAHAAPYLGGNGAAHCVDVGAPDTANRVQQLRQVVSEITQGRIPVPERRGPRF